MTGATRDSRTTGTRRAALLVLALAAVALVPALTLLTPDHGLRHPALLVLLFVFGICASRVEVHMKTKGPLKLDGGYALVLIAVALSGPLAGLIVFLSWDVASRLIWREHPVFTPGALANLVSYGWSALAASEVLRLAGATTLSSHAATGLFTAGIAMGVVQFAIARVGYATLYQGFRTWPLLRTEFPDYMMVILADVLLGTITAVLFSAVGLPAFAIFALVILVPSLLLLPALARRHSVTQLDQGAAAALYATALCDVLRLSRDRRRVLAGAAYLLHHSKHSPDARWSDLHDIEFAARYAGEHYDGNGGPAALTAGHIPLESRILAVGTRWAQLTAAGSQQLSHTEALLGLELAAGSALDPYVVAAAGEIVNAELPFARDDAFQPVLHKLPLPRTLRRTGLPHALANLDRV